MIRSASSKKDRDTARALLEEYLRLPVVGLDQVPALGLVVLTELDQGTASLSRMYVRPESRNRGLGRELLAEAIHRAHGALCRRIRLDVLSTRMPAIALYRSCDFTIESTPDVNGLIVMAADV